MAVHYLSATSEWETPLTTFNELDDEFVFTLDVCALPENAKCAKFFTPEQNGLNQVWIGVCWMNPPYGRQIGRWIKKAYESALAGATVVCLVPSRTDTRWFHDYVLRSSDVRFIRGRLYFLSNKTVGDRAPFPSMVVVFSPETLKGKSS